ncbi:MAG: hypothetical protein ACTFAK_00730 [Candidatus Electronema sp. VV]
MEISYAVSLICCLLAILFGGFAVHRWKRRVESADAFRETILHELQGVYPKDTGWSDVGGQYVKIKNSIDTVKIAAEKFAVVLSNKSKVEFKQAVESYCEHTLNINRRTSLAHAVAVELLKTADAKDSPVNQLINDIELMLSFTRLSGFR